MSAQAIALGIICVIFLAYLATMAYAVTHQDKTFWKDFLNPNGLKDGDFDFWHHDQF